MHFELSRYRRTAMKLLGLIGSIVLAYTAIVSLAGPVKLLGLLAVPILLASGLYGNLSTALFVVSSLVFVMAITGMSSMPASSLALGLALIGLSRYPRIRIPVLLTPLALVAIVVTSARAVLGAAKTTNSTLLALVDPLLESRIGLLAIAFILVSVLALVLDQLLSVMILYRLAKKRYPILDSSTLQELLRAETWEPRLERRIVTIVVAFLAAPMLSGLVTPLVELLAGSGGSSIWLGLVIAYIVVALVFRVSSILARVLTNTRIQLAMLITLLVIFVVVMPESIQGLLGTRAIDPLTNLVDEQAYLKLLEREIAGLEKLVELVIAILWGS